MSILEDIAEFLDDNNVGDIGTDMFIGEIPVKKGNDRINDAINIIAGISPEPNLSIEVFDQVVDFWVRYRNSDTGYTKMQAIRDLLHLKATYDLTNYHVYFSNSLGTIEDNDRDIEKRKLWKLSMRFIYREL